MEYQALFDRYSHKETLNRDQFQCAYIEYTGTKLTDYQVKVIFKESTGGKKQMGRQEFKGVMERQHVSKDTAIERLFGAVDISHGGKITKDHLGTLLKKHQLEYLRTKHLDSLFSILDQENKGWVGVQDIKSFYRRYNIQVI